MSGILLFTAPEVTQAVVGALPPGSLCGIIGAKIRPHQHAELARIASARSVPFLVQPLAADPAYPEFVSAVETLRPSLILSVAYSMLIRSDVVACATRGGVNIHPALLPAFRGPNPIQWAMIEGATEIGVTLHHLAPEVDAGDIVDQRRIPVSVLDTWRDLQAKIDVETTRLLAWIPRLLDGNAPRAAQREEAATRYRRRQPADGRIDWVHPVRRIHAQVRALVAPLPGAWYADPGGPVVLAQAMTLAEVAALKHARLPQIGPEGSPLVSVGPAGPGGDAAGTRREPPISLTFRPPGGELTSTLRPVDNEWRRVGIHLSAARGRSHPDTSAVVDWLHNYVTTELEAEPILVLGQASAPT